MYTQPRTLRSVVVLPIALAALVAATRLASANIAVWVGKVGTSVNTNWSTLSNWTNTAGGGAGPTQNNATFNDFYGVGAGVINNVVDTSQNPFALVYTNYTTTENTLIAPNQQLVVSTGGLTVGTGTATGNTNSPTATIAGTGATLTVSNGNVTVGQSYTSATTAAATLDLSGLDNFVATNVSQMLVGVGSARMAGTLNLAKTNQINATGSSPMIDIGDNTSNSGPGSTLNLGQTNAIFVNSIAIGLRKQNNGGGGTLKFNSAFASPVAYFRGTSRTNAVATWAIADGQAQSATVTDSGTADFSLGTVNALVSSMWIGRNSTGASANSAANHGTFTLGAGSFVVNNLTNGMLASSAQTPTVTGTINVNGPGSLIVNNNFVMGAINGFVGTCYGTLNISGGTVQAPNLIFGNSAFDAVTMTGGTLIVTNPIGTPSAPLPSLTLGSATLDLFPAYAGTATNIVTTTLDLTNTANIVNIPVMPVLDGYPSYFALISYASLTGGGSISLGTLPGTYMGYVSNDSSSLVIWLAVTNGPATAKADLWVGNVSSNWDLTTLNWKSGGAVHYTEGDFITFDDSATSTNVYLTAARSPTTLLVTNNTLNYNFIGVGSIGGAVILDKEGTNSLKLGQTGGDSFSGGITVGGGTLILDQPSSSISGGLTVASGATAQVGNGDASGGLPAGPIDIEGALIFDRTDNPIVSSSISGAGSLTQNGSGTLTLSVSNGYTGNTTVNAGTLALATGNAIWASAQVSLNSAGLNLSGVTGSTTLNALVPANATITLAVAYAQTPLNVSSLSAGGATNIINITALPPIATYPTTLTLIQSASLISGFNFGLGTVPAASPAYGGNVILSADGLAVLLTLTNGPVGVRPYVLWDGADAIANVNTNWSDGQNWQLPGAPGVSDYVIFSDVAATVGAPFSAVGAGPSGIVNPTYLNNIVSNSTTISAIQYSNVLSDYHNTLLASGVTLNVVSTNTAPRVVTLGSGSTDFGPNAIGSATIAGINSTLRITDTNSLIFVGLGSTASPETSTFTLDMSGLGSFDATVNQFFIGVGSSAEGIGEARESGTVYLAATNALTLTVALNGSETSDTSSSGMALDVGENDGNGGVQCSLYLGQTNAIFADGVGTGRQKQKGQVLFNPAFNNPAAYFRGQNGVAPVSVWSLGDGIANSGTVNNTGINDFTAGSVNALVNTMYIGRGANNTAGTGTAVGTLSFSNGLFNVNTLYLGNEPAAGAKIGNGTVNVSAPGTLVVNQTLNLALTAGGTGAASTWGVLNINGGTVTANTIVVGTGGSTTTSINLTNGTLILSNTVGATAAPLPALNLNGGTIVLNLNGDAGVTNIVATTVTTNGTTTLQLASIVNANTGIIYPLISYTGNDPFTSLSLAPLPAGFVGSLVDDTAASVVGITFTTTVPPTPTLTGISISGPTLTLTASNGAYNGQFVLLGTTNVTLPISLWKPILTNAFNGSGMLNLSTNVINPALREQFYILKQ